MNTDSRSRSLRSRSATKRLIRGFAAEVMSISRPTLPVNDGGAGRLPRQAARPAVRHGISDGHHAYRALVLGYVEQGSQIAHRMDAEEPGDKPFVHRRKQDGHHRGPGIDPPIGDRPVDLGPSGPSLSAPDSAPGRSTR